MNSIAQSYPAPETSITPYPADGHPHYCYYGQDGWNYQYCDGPPNQNYCCANCCYYGQNDPNHPYCYGSPNQNYPDHYPNGCPYNNCYPHYDYDSCPYNNYPYNDNCPYNNYPYNDNCPYNNYPYNDNCPYNNGYDSDVYNACYNEAPAVVTSQAFDLKVETNPSGIASVSGAGTYNPGTVASFSLTSTVVQAGTNERYVFSRWSGNFAGSAPSGTITMDAAKTVVANYQQQNYLTVAVDPPGIRDLAGDGWYNSGLAVTLGPVPRLVPGNAGVQYVFDAWTVDASPVSGNTVQVTMSSPHTVTAHYKTQYLVTVDSEYGYAVGSGWYDAGSSAKISVTTNVDTSYGVSQVFDGWTGDYQSTSPDATITVNSPLSVRAVWRTDSTVLYSTMGLAVAGALIVGIGLTAIALRKHQQRPTIASSRNETAAHARPL